MDQFCRKDCYIIVYTRSNKDHKHSIKMFNAGHFLIVSLDHTNLIISDDIKRILSTIKSNYFC